MKIKPLLVCVKHLARVFLVTHVWGDLSMQLVSSLSGEHGSRADTFDGFNT